MGNGLICQTKEDSEIKTGKCRIWCGIHHPSFEYPELQESESTGVALKKHNLGIALSGGGFRAASLAIGTLRGLHILGVLSESRYLSSNSGSSWVNGPFSYSQVDLSQFLGPYLPPDQCTLTNLRKIDVNSHSYTICGGGNLDTFFKELRSGITSILDNDTRGFWSQAVGKIFFHDYDLNNFDHLPVLSSSIESLRSRLPAVPNKYSPYCCERSPYPIINGSVLVRGERVFAPIEFTPMYYSFPAFSTYYESEENGHGESVGGYLIEPFGLATTPSSSQLQLVKNRLNPRNISFSTKKVIANTNLLIPKRIEVAVNAPGHVISVSDQSGISSSALTQVAAHKISSKEAQLIDFSVYPLWNPLCGSYPNMIFADGGGCDNTAIIALLRRKVTKIIAMYAIDQSIMNSVDHRNMSQSTFSDVAGLFGVMTCDGDKTIDGITPLAFNKYHHVFPSEDYSRLVDGLRSRYLEGRPCTFLLHTRVLPNPDISVPGNHDVDILFILCAPSDDWVNSLPQDVKCKVLNERHDSQMKADMDNISSFIARNASTGEEEALEDEKMLSDLIDEAMIKLRKKIDPILPSSSHLDQIREKLRNIFESSSLKNFPYPPIESLDYTSQLVNLLTNLMTWEVVESSDLIEELLGCDLKSFLMSNQFEPPQSPNLVVEDF